MSWTGDASKEYLKHTILTAAPEQLHAMLLDGAVRFAVRGREALLAQDFAGAFGALDRAQRIVLELSSGLRRDVNPTLVERMTALYGFIYRRLIDATLHRNIQALDDALRILRHQRETWELLLEKLKQDAPGAAGPGPSAAATANRPADAPVPFVVEG